MSDEQLVRMGRTDLYRRGDTEIVNGRRVAKPGAEPKTVLTTTLDAPHSCAYEHDGAVCRVDQFGAYWERGTFCENDLVVIDPAQKLVPWEFSEVPAKNWFRRKGLDKARPVQCTDQNDNTILIDGDWYDMNQLVSDYDHSEHHCGPFEPCGKYQS